LIFSNIPQTIQNLNSLGIALKSLNAIDIPIVRVNTGNITSYQNAIKGLSAEQAVYALSTKGVTAAQIEEIMTTETATLAKGTYTEAEIQAALAKQGLAASTTMLTAQQQAEIVNDGILTQEKLAEVAAVLGLTTAENGNLVSKEALTASMVKEKLTSIGVVGAQQQQILSILGLTAAEGGAITATNLLTAAWTKLTTAIVKHPIGAALVAVTAIIAGIVAYKNHIKNEAEEAEEAIRQTHESAKNALQESKSALSQTQGDLQGIESELSNIDSQLKSIASKTSLEFVDGTQIAKLSQAKRLLEQQKTILTSNERIEAKSAARDAKELLETQVEKEYYLPLGTAENLTKASYDYKTTATKQAEHLISIYDAYITRLENNDTNGLVKVQDSMQLQIGSISTTISDLIDIVSSFTYADGTIIEGYEDLYEEYTGYINKLQALSDLSSFDTIIDNKQTENPSVDLQYLYDEILKTVYAGTFDIANVDSTFIDAFADYGIDKDTLNTILSVKEQEFKEALEGIEVFNPDNIMPAQYMDKTGTHTDEEETRKAKNRAKSLYDALTSYSETNPLEFQLMETYDDGFKKLKQYFEDDFKITNDLELSAENAIQQLKDEVANSDIGAEFFNSFTLEGMTEHLESLNGILTESKTSAGLTTESIEAIETAFGEMDGYDASKIFERTAQGIQLNTNELRKLENEYQKTNKEQLEKKLTDLKDKYETLTNSINDSTDATERANFASEQNSLGKQIIETERLISQYSALISKYQAWQNAQSNGEAGDTYDTIRNGLEGIQELVDNGLIGTEELRAYTELLSGKDLSNANAEKVKETFNSLKNTIEGTSVSVMDFLGEGGTGVNNFLTAMEQLGYYFQDEDGKWTLSIDNKEDVANQLGTSVEFVENILEKMSDYGFEVDIDTSPAEASLDELKGWVGEANDTLKDLEVTNLTFNIDSTDIDDLDTQIRELTNKKGKIKLKPDEKGFAEAQTILAALIRQKQELEEKPAVMNVSVSNDTKDNSEKAILYLQELYNEYNDYQVNVKIGADTSENKKKIKEIKEKIKELPTSVKTALKIDTSKLNLRNIKKKINKITPDMIVKAGVDETKVKDYKAEDKSAKVTYTVDDTAVTDFKNKNHDKTATLTYDVKTNGKAKVDGTAHLFGTAYSKGNFGTKTAGTALGGEVKPEMLVRNGKWSLIGKDSAEFFQYKKGDIIFNGDQTEQILKYGKIISGNRRGKSFAEGTAFNIGSANATGNNKYVPNGNISNDSGSGNGKNNGNSTDTDSTKEDTKLEKFQDWISKFIDWIEVRLSRLQGKIDIAINKAERYAENGSFEKSATQYRKAIKDTQKLIDANTAGAKRYNEQANKVLNKAVNDGLISSSTAKGIKAKVENGTIDINSYGERTQAVIKEYQTFYENSLDCSEALVDLNANLREYYLSLYNLPIEEATRKIDKLSNSLEILKTKADTVEGGGKIYNRVVVEDAKTNKTIADKKAKKADNKVKSTSKTLLSSLKGKEKKVAKKKIKAGKKVSTKNLSGKALKNALAYNSAVEAKRVANIEKKDANADYKKALKQQKKYADAPDYKQVNDFLDDEIQNSKKQNKIYQESARKTSKNLTKAERRKNAADKAIKGFTDKQKDTDAYKKAVKEQKDASKALSAARKANKTATDNAKKSEAEYTQTLQENTKAKLDNIASSFDSTRGITSAKMSKLESKNDLKEILGINLKQSDYNSLISNAKTDVTTAEKALNAYQEVYNKNKKNLSAEDKKVAQEQLQQLKQEVYEAQKVQAELENTKIQIPFDNLEEGIELLDSLKNRLSALISLKNALGEDEGSQVYLDMIAKTQEQANKAKSGYELAMSNKALAEANSDGVYGGKSVDDWQKEADEYLAEEYKYLEEVKTIKNDLAEYYIEPFEKAIDSMERFADILKGMSDLIDDDMLLDSDGHFTEYGITQIATSVQQYETARDKIQKYEEELEQVNQNYADGLYTLDEYNEKTAELHKNILGGASDMKSAMDSVIKMYKDMSKAELDNLFALIDARNDALKAKKDYYDYDKTLREKTKDVQSLQSQLAALDGITTAEAKARRAQLLSDLSEAQDELDETVQDHLLEISQDSLDDMKDVLQEGFDEMWDKVSKDLDEKMKVFSVGQSLATDSVNSVNETLKYLLSYYGVDDSNSSGLVEAHYARGTKSVPRTLKALVAEKGKGEIITSQDGMIMTLHQGDGVVPNDLAERIYDMATNGYAPSLAINEIKLPNISNGNPNIGVTQHYDSLINIEGSADAATVEDLKKLSKDILEKSYGYTTKRLYKDYIHSGGKRKV
jgi:hypothetical protein